MKVKIFGKYMLNYDFDESDLYEPNKTVKVSESDCKIKSIKKVQT